MSELQCFSGPPWLVAHTGPLTELRVRDAMIDDGFEAYVPVETLKARGIKQSFKRPLLPGYAFFSGPEWQRVESIKGVLLVLRAGLDVPGRVPGAWIDAMRKAEDVGVFDHTAEKPTMFALNEQVRVGEGPFAGFNGLIVEFIAKMRSTTAKKRAKVLVEMLGRMTAIEIDLTSLEKL